MPDRRPLRSGTVRYRVGEVRTVYDVLCSKCQKHRTLLEYGLYIMFCALNFSSSVHCGPHIFKIRSKSPRGTVWEKYGLYTTFRALNVRRPLLLPCVFF